jgi:dimethylamine monooxygenase subunit A
MLRHFPFDHDEYDMPMNARAGVESLIEIDEGEYLKELALKDEILESDYSYYYKCDPQYSALAWESVEVVLLDMAANYPQFFSLSRQGSYRTWTNSILGTTTEFTYGLDSTLPLPPLDWLGRQVQEDLILMAELSDGDTEFAAGHLCFAAGWCLEDKMRQRFLRVHEDVPQFLERIGRPADLMMRRLKPGRPTARFNWTIGSINRLNLAKKLAHEWVSSRVGITAENAGDRCFLRVERQTFSRLPTTRGILFTIHTYINSVAEVVEDLARLNRFTTVIKGIPRATIEYKGMAGYADELINYLEAKQRKSAGLPPTTVPGQREDRSLTYRREPVMGNICYSRIDTSFWELMPLDEPDMLIGDPDPKVHWLKKNEKGDPTYLAGLWYVQPSKFRWLFFGNESFHVLEGRATITIEDGTSVEVRAGDVVSFPMDTPSVWVVTEPLKKFFVISM